MSFRHSCLTVLGCALMLPLATASFGQQTPPQADPAQQLPPAGEQQRTFEQVLMELQRVSVELAPVMSDQTLFTDAEARRRIADTAVPGLRRMVELLGEASELAPQEMREQFRSGRYQILALLAVFGDEQARQQLEQDNSPDARSALLLSRFITAEQEEARNAAVADLSKLADEHGESLAVAQAALAMWSLAQEDQTKQQVRVILDEKLQGEVGQQIRMALRAAEEAEQEIRAFEERFIGKPLTIEGQTLQGESFSTSQWKGKVVMVDFWATWCAPCLAAMPKIIEDYDKYHEQGLEIVGVSLDRSVDPLRRFLAENPNVRWTQIFTADDPQASAQIANNLDIQAIPTVFLIDRNGIVRAMAVGGGAEMQKLHDKIPELLREEPRSEQQRAEEQRTGEQREDQASQE